MNITPVNSTETYEIPQTTVLGALDAASMLGAFEYQVAEGLPPDQGNLSIVSITDIENEMINQTPYAWTYWVNGERATIGPALANVTDGDNVTYSYGPPPHTIENASYTLTVLVNVTGVTPMPTPDENVTPMPTPDENVTPMPTPDENVTPMPTPDENVTPMPTPDENVTPMPTPDENVTPMPTPDENMTPSVNVSDQPIENDTVIVERAVMNQTGWADIHADLNGTPGPIIGYSQITEGVNENVTVEIETENATPVLYAMLHIDAGEQGVHEFPGPDVPVLVNGTPVQQAFNVTGGLPDENVTPMPTPDENVTPMPTPDENVTPMPTPDENVTPMPTPDENVTPMPTPDENVTPSVNVSDQPIENDTVIVERAVMNQTGWADIHADLNGTPGPIIGYSQITEGVNENVTVEIETENATPVLYAMLHIDAGEQGVHEFPGPDVPVLVNGTPVQQAFNVTGGLPDENVTPMPTPDENVTPMPTPDENVTPMPTPDENVTPMPTPDENVTPMPTPDENVTPMPTPDENVTPMPTPDENVTPMPTPDENVTPMPTPDENVTPTPTPAVNITDQIIEGLEGEENLTTFIMVLNNSTIDEELDENMSYAICAPTNEAFEGLGNETLSTIQNDTELLNTIIGYHIILSSYTIADLVALCENSENGQISLPTVEGTDVNVTLTDSGQLVINNIIVVTQIQITNNIIVYVIGGVLVPPGTQIPTPTPTPDENVTPTPTPDENVTPIPTPDENVTPTPTPDENVTPTPTPDENVTPTPTPDENVTPTPTPDENVTPTPTPDENVTPTPTPDENVTPTPTPTANVTPMPTLPPAPPAEETVDLELYGGWNFVSIPRQLSVGNNTVEAVFGDVDTGGRSVYTFAPATGFTPVGANTTLQVLEGYWVYSTEDLTLQLNLSTNPMRSPASKTLSPGWNAIGYSDLTPRTADETLKSVEDNWVSVIGFDAENQNYHPALINNQTGEQGEDQNLFPTEGYWIFMRDDGRLAAISA
ncbi:DUF7282 domain-containing protein [Methanoculleus caldifontis]|uniref:DUF7282 domain-containing protein n=1 Tax=Methanoculleus caldifontis TaxID=2651577 RepID=UPI002936D5ED|nr:fasciclin domain-containing protein [Methanoculleus sp. Wushi-C6]